MKIEFLKWYDWDAVKYSVGYKELIIGISAGPRILSASIKDNENLLYLDKTDLKVGNWRMYGGHRFTLAPESPESYYPDNDYCEVEMINNKLVVTSPKRPSGLQLSIELSQKPKKNTIEINHTLYNHGNTVWNGALWAITCVPRFSKVFAYCETDKINFWPDTNPSNWEMGDKYVRVKDGSFRGKAGWHTQNPKLFSVQEKGVLAVRNSDESSPNECVDNGSNVEIFVCSNYIELETLSKKINLLPKKSSSHLQRWQLFEPSKVFCDPIL